MQQQIYKKIFILIVILTPLFSKAQVFGGYFYISKDSSEYTLKVYGVSEVKLYNEEIQLGEIKIREKEMDTIYFSRFKQKDSLIKPVQLYKALVLKLSKNIDCSKEMIIIITGYFDERLNYELNIKITDGIFCIFIPRYGEGLEQLNDSYIAPGCKNINSLIKEM